MVGKNCESKDRMAMDLNERFIQIGLIFLLLIPSSHSQQFLDAITPNQPLGDGRVLISSRKFFALGFLRIGSFDNYYLAVWYNKVAGNAVVWVANGDKPLRGSPGVLAIKDDGGLAVYANNSSSTTPVWSANVTLSSPNNFTAKLRDTGNLVLLEKGSQRVVWQSFDYPSNTMLPSMKIGLDRRAGINRFLTSWKSKDDPGTGSFTWGWDTSGFPQMMLNKRGTRVWRAGPWTGERFNGLPGKISYKELYDASIVNNEDELTTMYTSVNDSLFTRIVVDESGIMQQLMWNYQKNEWILLNSQPNDLCDNYGKCGPNSNCDLNSDYTFPCTCLPGFEPKSTLDWNLRIGLAGCVRKTGVDTCRNGEGFVQVKSVKMPDTSTAKVNLSMKLEDCELKCLMDCSCTAYSGTDDEESKNGCLTWHGDLKDMRTFPNVAQIINVRVDAITVAQNAKSSGAKPSKKGRLTISLSVLAAVLLVTLLCWLIWRKIKGKRGQDEHPFILDTGLTYFDESDNGSTTLDESRINSELLFFHLNTIEKATNNFSLANKLGEGGFGSVYKGVLPNGKEIAVKRLSKNSGQGVEEFKNEVLLIAKLQHRNLVRILGSCIEHDEKILIYEYLCNKSLDSFIFNETKRAALNWTRRYKIILGIARGILYLHEDSRLRIIHRDLKASNVLLDGSLNPKVADFGMARMFRGEQSEANTNHVVGTYGYMSPEYAMEGLFSVKSDVYSFGILLLEIITSKKNAGYHHEEHPDSNLVGHVWELWKEGRTLEVIDSFMCKLYPADQVQRCIQIALLCVQEFPRDRPSMSEVVFMLGNDAALPSPSRPAFVLKRMNAITDPSSSEGVNSINDVTCTAVEAR